MTTMGIRDNRYEAQVPTVTGPVTRPKPVHADSVRFLRRHATRQLKFTLPGPMTICDTIADAHYGSRPAMAMAFAELLNAEARELQALGVDVIQFDEPAFNAFMADVPTWGVDCLHRAIEGLTCKTAVHICYGYGIQANLDWKETLGDEWRQYEVFFPALNASRIDQVSLECADSHVPLSVLATLKDKEVLVGAINVATTAIETPEKVAATLRAALDYVDPERLVACTNCGMAPLPRPSPKPSSAPSAPAPPSPPRARRQVTRLRPHITPPPAAPRPLSPPRRHRRPGPEPAPPAAKEDRWTAAASSTPPSPASSAPASPPSPPPPPPRPRAPSASTP